MNKKNNFEYIEFTNLEYIQESFENKKSIKDIRINYKKYFLDENLHFLCELDLVEIKKDMVFRKKPYEKNKFLSDLLKILKKSESEYGIFFQDFIKKFKSENQYTYRANMYEKNQFAHLSRFLINAGVLQKDAQDYKILKKYIKYFAKRKKSLKEFKEEQKNKELIGENAENEIIKYEIRRTREFIVPGYEIKKISNEDIAAGYDIESWDILDNNIFKIYIEVKAVKSGHKKRFHWSRNEMDIAKDFKKNYYLYLLPHDGPKKYYIDKLTRICDPYSLVYENTENWDKKRSDDMIFEEIQKN